MEATNFKKFVKEITKQQARMRENEGLQVIIRANGVTRFYTEEIIFGNLAEEEQGDALNQWRDLATPCSTIGNMGTGFFKLQDIEVLKVEFEPLQWKVIPVHWIEGFRALMSEE